MIVTLELSNYQLVEDITMLQHRAYRVEAKLIGFEDIPALKENPNDLMSSEEIFYGAFMDECLVGIISYKLVDEVLDIHRVAVDPDYFRRGIAKALLTHCLNKVCGYKAVEVSTGKGNGPAEALYLHMGFEQVEEIIINDLLTLVKFRKNHPSFYEK